MQHTNLGPIRARALQEDNDNDAKSLENMVEPSGLEPLTSTLPVSKWLLTTAESGHFLRVANQNMIRIRVNFGPIRSQL